MWKEMGGSFKRKGTYAYRGWFMLMFSRNQQNSVKQLPFNLKKKKKKSGAGIPNPAWDRTRHSSWAFHRRCHLSLTEVSPKKEDRRGVEKNIFFLLRAFFFFFFLLIFIGVWASLLAQTVKNLPAMQEIWVWPLSQEDLLEKRMATHTSIVAWRSPWTEEPNGLQSIGS